jgi:hexosaminidase
MPKTTSFWPPVQRLQRGAGRFELDAPARYWAPELPQLGRRLQKLLHRFQLEATPASAANEATIQLEIRPDVAPRRYRLTIDERAISISGADAEALGYGVTTLGQWARLHEHPPRRGLALPAVVIDDAPDLAVRGLMLDISRDKVPSMQTLRDLVDILCDFKLNQLQLYTEHTFAYRGHEQVWCDASPLMPSEIRELDAYCRDHEIELVPNQNSFAHFHRWLKHERYRPLSECPDGIDHPFSPTREPFSLCPTDERVFALLSDLYGQLLPCFSSARFNVGLDEAFDLGCCRSAAAAAARGKAALFADYLDRIATLAAEHGRSVQYWADMVLAENVPLERLPKDGSALIWGYEADHPFAAQAERLANANLSFYLCPGTSSWNSFVGRSTNALVNLSQAAVAARDHRADGYLITDWGDNGHHQPLSVSFLPIVAGAGFAWRTDAAAALDREAIRAAVDRYLLDANPELGAASLLERLADAHLLAGATPKNSSAPFNLVVRPQWPLDHAAYRGLTSSGLQRCSDEVADCCSSLARIAETLRDGQLLCDELTLAGAWVQLGCAVGRARLGHESAFSCHAGTEFAFSCHAGTEFAFSCHAGTEFAFSCHAGTEFAFSCHAGTEFAFSCHAGTEFAFSCHAGTEFAFSCHAGTEFAFSCHAGTEFAFSCHAGAFSPRNSRSHATQAPNSRSHATQAPNSRSHATQAPNSRSHATQAPNSRSHATQAPNSRSHATQAPNSRSHATQAPNSRSHATQAPNSRSHATQAPNSRLMPRRHRIRVLMPRRHRIRVLMPRRHRIRVLMPRRHRIRVLMPRRHRIRVLMPRRHRIRVLMPRRHRIRVLMPRRHRIRVLMPRRHRIRVLMPRRHRIRVLMPRRHRIRVLMPRRHRIRVLMPRRHRIRVLMPRRHRIRVLMPRRHRIRVLMPRRHRIRVLMPRRHRIRVLMPRRHRIRVLMPRRHRIRVLMPRRHRIRVLMPRRHRIRVLMPRRHRIRVLMPRRHRIRVLMPRRHRIRVLMPRRHRIRVLMPRRHRIRVLMPRRHRIRVLMPRRHRIRVLMPRRHRIRVLMPRRHRIRVLMPRRHRIRVLMPRRHRIRVLMPRRHRIRVLMPRRHRIRVLMPRRHRIRVLMPRRHRIQARAASQACRAGRASKRALVASKPPGRPSRRARALRAAFSSGERGRELGKNDARCNRLGRHRRLSARCDRRRGL